MSIQVPSSPATSPEARAERSVVEGHSIVERFGLGTSAVDALRGVDVSLASGSFTAIMGPSGSPQASAAFARTS